MTAPGDTGVRPDGAERSGAQPGTAGAASPLGLDLSALALSTLGPAAHAQPAPATEAVAGATADGVGAGGQPPVRQLSAAQAALRGVLFRRRGPLMLRHGQRQAAALLTALPPGLPADPADTPWLALTIDGAPAAAALPWSLCRRLLGQPLEPADPGDAALLLEDALSDWLDAAELATGLAIRFARLDTACPDIADAVTARLSVDLSPPQPARQALVLRLSPGAVHAAAGALARLVRPRGEVGALMLRVSVLRTAARLTMAELASLAPGDALAMTDDTDDAAAVIEDRLAAPASPTPTGGWMLTRGFAPLADRTPHSPCHAEQAPMTQPDDDQPPPPIPQPDQAGAADSAPAPARAPAPAPRTDAAPHGAAGGLASLDALQVRLSVRLGETLVSVADLRQSGPGTVITLDRPDGAPLDLVVNGQIIGTGQIITVAGHKAVEIHSLFGDG